MIYGRVQFDRDPVQEALKLCDNLNNKAIRIAMNKAAATMKKAVVDTAPTQTQALKKSIRIRIKQYKSKGVWVAIVGPKSDYKRKNRRPARYAHLMEKRTHFLSTAFSNTKDVYLQTLEKALADQISLVMKDK